jgi:hypothetical protein
MFFYFCFPLFPPPLKEYTRVHSSGKVPSENPNKRGHCITLRSIRGPRVQALPSLIRPRVRHIVPGPLRSSLRVCIRGPAVPVDARVHGARVQCIQARESLQVPDTQQGHTQKHT